MMSTPTEETNLLTGLPEERQAEPNETKSGGLCTISATLRGVLVFIFVATLAAMLFWYEGVQYGGPNGGHGGSWWMDRLPEDSNKAAAMLLEQAPVIDGHIDLPWLVRRLYANNASAVDMTQQMPDHVDIPRLRAGKVGGFFWSIYLECESRSGVEEGPDHIKPTWLVRDALEQIDVAHLLIDKYRDTFELALTAAEIKAANRRGKIASILGLEGAHHLGNSLGALRQMYRMGVRYMTLTHVCHNAFADSSGMYNGIEPKHDGLSHFGRVLVHEMNRLGMLVDLSHVSEATALQAINITRAPVMFSHSSPRALHAIPRNVPDSVLEHIGEGAGKVDGVVMVPFYPPFISHDRAKADLSAVADHVEHIARLIGHKHVGIGSDFDGIDTAPIGLEDVSKYPDLVAELHRRGWTKLELSGFTGANILRVMEGAERVAREMAREGVQPAMEIYEKRPDLPMKDKSPV